MVYPGFAAKNIKYYITPIFEMKNIFVKKISSLYYNADETSTTSGFPMELLSCTKLQIINMEYQGIVSVPPAIENLKELTQLNLNFNPNLLGIPAELGKIETLKGM